MNEKANTHLWIINRAADMLERDRDSNRRRMAQWMEAYRNRLARGNHDTDRNKPFCNRGWHGLYYGRLFSSHFYDPDTMTNWRGEAAPTARSEGARYFAEAGSLFRQGDHEGAFYYLGVSLHYLTDITMPFHAANFTYLHSNPRGYHTEVERYAATIKERFGLSETLAQAGHLTGPDPGQWIHHAAVSAKAWFPALWNPVTERYWKRRQTAEWQQAVTPVLGEQLKEAQRVTAGFIHLWFQTFGGRLESPVTWGNEARATW